MKKVVWALAILALMSGAAQAQDKAALEKALIANEHKVADALMKKDKATVTSLIAADGWSADGNGFMKSADFFAALDQLVIKSYRISDEKVAWVDANTAIVGYKWTGAGTFAGQPFPTSVYASSVWTKRGDKWVAVFHQETEVAKPAKPAPPKPVKK